MKRQLLTSKEAAYYLGVSEAQLRISRNTGELFKGVASPRYRLFQSAVRYSQCDLDRWIHIESTLCKNTAQARLNKAT